MGVIDSAEANCNAEIILIGTGGGYGESVLINLGNNTWCVVDSCRNPYNKTCLPLNYLKERNVDVASDVKLIVCTHWHDDHILGISQLYEEAKSSKLCIAPCHDAKKFLQFVGLDYKKAKISVSNSSTVEFGRCIEILKQRGASLTRAVANKLLYKTDLGHGLKSEIIALSPSDYVLDQYDLEISTLMNEYCPSPRKVPALSPNAKSVALFLKLGNHRVILGADLEYSESSNMGWLNVVHQCSVIDQKSSLFKIPHHGSRNAYCEEVWNTLLTDNVVGKITPWNKNEKLPTQQMVDKYKEKAGSLFATLDVDSVRFKRREKRIEKFLRTNIKAKIWEVRYSEGRVSSVIDPWNSSSLWHTTLEGAASQLK